jgi:hypothetical protein
MNKLRHRERLGGESLKPAQRQRIADALSSALLEERGLAWAVGEVEAGIAWYVGDVEQGLNERLADKDDMKRELAALGQAARVLLDRLDSLTSEARDRMIGPDATGECGGRVYNELLPPERLYAPVMPCLSISKRSTEAIRELMEERRGGRPRDVAAHRLVRRLSSIWQTYTDGRMDRESRDGVRSAWTNFVMTVLDIAGADVGGERLARDVAGQWPRADKTGPGEGF